MNNEWRDLPSMADVAAAQAAGDEIEYKNAMTSWNTWNEDWWNDDAKFRARPAQQKRKKIRMLCYTDYQALMWRCEDVHLPKTWVRVPSEDKEIEVLEYPCESTMLLNTVQSQEICTGK